MDANSVFQVGGAPERHAAGMQPASIGKWIQESAGPGTAGAHDRIRRVLEGLAAGWLHTRLLISIRPLSGLIAWMLLVPAAHAIYYGAPQEPGDLSQTLKTPWVFYDFGYGFDGCFDSEQAITDAWIAWRMAGGACSVTHTGKDPDWPADPEAGLTIDIPRGCVPAAEYNLPEENSIPLVRQHARFQFEKLIYACTANDWHPEEWMFHRESYEYCPEGYGFSLLTGTPWIHFCKREKPVYDQCLLEGNKLLSIGTGSKKHAEVDFMDTRHGQFHLQRHYNSNYSIIVGKRQAPGLNPEPAVGMFGANWRSSFEKSIYYSEGASGTLAALYRDDATLQFFNKQPDGSWISNSDIRHSLEKTATGWNYRTSEDVVEIYDLAGRLHAVHYLDGAVTTLSYDDAGRLYAAHSNTGESLTFYADPVDADDLVDSVTDHTGRVWKYAYDANSNLEYVIYPDGTPGSDADNPVRQYHYEDANYPGALTGITDERGLRYATFAYDINGRATTGFLGDSTTPANSIDVDYHNDDHRGDGMATRTVTDSRGTQSVYTTIHRNGVALLANLSGTGCEACGAGDSSYSYDPLTNNLLSVTKNGITTAYGNYDTNGNPGFRIGAKGTSEQHRTDYSYDPRFFGKVTSILEPSVFAADPAAHCTDGVDCRKTEYSYDDRGNRLTETISGFSPDGAPVSRTTTYQYNGPLHQLSRIDGPRTDVSDITTFEYYPDDPAEGANRARLKRVVAADGTVLHDSIGYTPGGKIASDSRPNNVLVTYSYFPGSDRLQAAVTHDLSTGLSSRTAWTYLPGGEVKSITTASLTPDATTLTFGYDAARRLTRITDGLGNYIQYTLDAGGNHTEENIHDSAGVLRKALSRTFDAYNRLDVSITGADPLGPLQQFDSDFSPDGTLDRQTDGNGVATDYSYDSLQRLLGRIQDPGGLEALTQYGYDAADNLISVTDPVNGNTRYVYDDLGNLLSVNSPDTGTTAYSYDAAGNLTTRVDARGQVFSYSYDALNRLTGVDAPGTADDISYAYDVCTNGIGRLCSVIQGNTLATYTYDAFGNVTGHQQLAYSYDAANRVRTMTYPSGAVVSYSYDAAGQVNQVDLSVHGSTTTLAGDIVYAPFGTVTGLSYGNGATLTQELDTAYRLTAQTVSGALELGYVSYDGNGNPGTRTDVLSGSSEFAYDALNRLVTGNGPFGVRAYDYDLNGNRTRLISDALTTGYGYVPLGNRLITEGGWTYTLDANGNATHKLAADGLGNVYTYNSHNRLVTAAERRVTGTSGKGKHATPVLDDVMLADYVYNGLGQRESKSLADGTVKRFLYGADGAMLAELDGSGAVQREYVYLNGQLLAAIDVTATPGSSTGGGTEVILDNGAAGTGSTGAWTPTYDRKNNQIGSNYLVAAGGSESTYRWTPLLTAGSYELFAWWVKDRKASAAVPFTIVHANGASTVTVDQTGSSARWVSLGIHDFTGNGTEYVEVSDANGKAIADAVRFVEQPVVVPPAVSAEVYYVHNDHLGTPQVMTDATGAVVWRAIYDPFGKAAVEVNSVEMNVRFPGQYFDSETGLHYNYFRYYDPNTGRYVASDLLGIMLDKPSPDMLVAEEAGQVELPYDVAEGYVSHSYAYVESNPMMYTDRYGLHHKHSHRWKPRPGSVSLGDYISDPNGNLWPGTKPQDWKCSLGPIFGEIGDACFPERCFEHDQCYEDNECNSSSWIPTLIGGSKSCNKCNRNFFD